MVHVLEEIKANMQSDELAKLTVEILQIHGEYQELGRKSVELVIECGRRLSVVNSKLPHGKWEDWCLQYKSQISITTIKRYIRLYNRSLVTDLTKMTLDEAYTESGILKKDNIKSKPPGKPQNGSAGGKTQTGDKKPSPEFEKFEKLLQQLLDIRKYSFSQTEKKALIRLLGPVVQWYQTESPLSLRKLPVVAIEVNEDIQEAI